MESRFTALRVIGVVFKILAWLALILGLLGAIGALFAGFTLSNQPGLLSLSLGGPLAGIAMFIVVLIVAIVNFMLFYAIGESIYLFLSIEENSRRTAYFLQQQYTPRQVSYPAAPAPVSYEE
jgi:hypothetical protein